MGRLKSRVAIPITAGIILSCQSVCADTDLTSVSTTSTKTVYETLSEKMALSYSGIYRGAALADMGNSLQPMVDGSLDESSPQSLENYVTTGYKLNPELMLGVTWRFMYFPVGNPAGSGQDLQMYDPSIVLAKSKLINDGPFKLSGRLNLNLPMTAVDRLQRSKSLASISPSASATYDVPNTALTLGLFGSFRFDVHSASSPNDAQTYRIIMAPNANYQLTKTLAATLWVDLVQATRNGGTGLISGLENAPVDIEPGINWDITPNISFNPILNIYPSNLTLAATSVMAIVTAKAF